MLVGAMIPATVENATNDVKYIVESMNGIIASRPHGEGVMEIYNTLFDE